MSEYAITKSVGVCQSDDGVPAAEDMELISHYARKTPDAKDIYIFTVTLCDNEVDRDNERFSLDCITALKDMFTGVTGIFDHSMKSSDQTARIYKTQVVTDDSRITSSGEAYTRLKAWCYMLRTEKNRSLIEEIDAGIKKEVSISCSVKSRICSVCGKDMRTHDCPHIQGETVNGKVCHAVLCDPTDAYEWSFVAVPAQRNAGVSKSVRKHKKTDNDITFVDSCEPSQIIKSINENQSKGSIALSAQQMKSLSGYILSMENEALAGRERRKNAETQIIALCAFTLPEADTKMLGNILKKLDTQEVFMLHKAFENKAADVNAFVPEFTGEKKKELCDNAQFRI